MRACRERGIQFPLHLALWLTHQVLMGLEYAHRKQDQAGQSLNIIHRDVSPANIMLGAGGAVKLIDFGIAQARGRLQQSASGTLQGKFVYMSPEQAVGRTLTPATDIFSAGLILYELICNLRPFDADSETETLRLVRACDVKAPRVYVPQLPEAVDTLIMKALSAAPSERFESAGAMARAIQHFLVLDDSQAGPGALSDFLREVFPNGVVPTEAPQPRTLDDALLNQLDAFTPSFARIEHTQTQTKTSGIERVSILADPCPTMVQVGLQRR